MIANHLIAVAVKETPSSWTPQGKNLLKSTDFVRALGVRDIDSNALNQTLTLCKARGSTSHRSFLIQDTRLTCSSDFRFATFAWDCERCTYSPRSIHPGSTRWLRKAWVQFPQCPNSILLFFLLGRGMVTMDIQLSCDIGSKKIISFLVELCVPFGICRCFTWVHCPWSEHAEIISAFLVRTSKKLESVLQ